jgi:hypothetical protein
MINQLRVILETDKDDVYRDIEIEDDATLEDLHNVIVQSFDFEGYEPAAFYLTDEELNQGLEIPLFNFDETKPVNNLMSNTLIKDVLSPQSPNLLYVYDFLNMWRFLVNLMDQKEEKEPGIEYPIVVQARGLRPEEAPDIQFEDGSIDSTDEFKDDLDNPFGEFYDYNDDEWN